MIKLVFTINRETFRVEIKEREIWYLDRKWKKAIRLVPKDEQFYKKIILSRNKIPHSLVPLFTLTEKEEAEYNAAKTEEDLAQICINDCRMKGAILAKRE